MTPTKQQEVKEIVLNKITEAFSFVPKQEVEDLPFDTNIGVPAWNDFEHKIWKIGEEIRQLILANKNLRADKEIEHRIILVALDRKAKRGRQSFILLLGYKIFGEHASELVSQINDEKVTGQVISTLTKMRAFNFKKEVKPYCLSKVTWIRNEAKKYISKSNSSDRDASI